MKQLLPLLCVVLLGPLFGGCNDRPTAAERPTIVVSILPLKYLAEQIAGDDFRVEVLVPAGASPETFEPTPRQFVTLQRAELVLGTGWIAFEQNLLQRLPDRRRVVSLCRGVVPIAGHEEEEGHHHPGGIDPHAWTSPRALQIMARNTYDALHALYPDSVKYADNLSRLQRRLDSLDRWVGDRIRQSGVRRFVIYHPALTYYARDYGIEQLAIEQEGKEPSARQLGRLIEAARASGVRRLLYQNQFPASVVETVARDAGAEAVAFDPLAEEVVDNIGRITRLITEP